MKSKIIFFILAAYLLLPAAYASSIAITQAGADSNTVMKGISFTVTVSDLSGTGSVSLMLPSGFSTEENTTKTFGGSTTSVSWTTVVANQKLSAQTISATITTTGSPETVTTSSFDAILPPSIVTSLSPSSITASAGSSYTINLNIQNYGETTANDVVVTLSLPSGFSLTTGASTQAISTISGGAGGSGETVGISWTVKANSPSTSTITITVSPSNADSKTDTITVTSSATTTTLGGSSGSAGAGNATTTTITLPEGATTTILGEATTTTVPSGSIIPPIPEEVIKALFDYGPYILMVIIIIIAVLGWLYYHGHKRFPWSKPKPIHE